MVSSPRIEYLTRRTKLVGRADELRLLRERLQGGAVVTLLGPPGVGKSRLAFELAARYANAGGATCVTDLTEAKDEAAVCAAVARGLEVADASLDLGVVLAARGPLLLVLDNVDQVTAAAESTVARWVEAAPELRVVATSRQRLAIGGEILFDVAPLSVPDGSADPRASDAVRLFVERAVLARRDATFSESDFEALGALVRALDGLPLAIELCAARIRVLSPREIVAQLPSRVSSLAGSGAARALGSRSLDDAIAVSWNGLGPEGRSMLAQISVFSGSFDLEAAEAVVERPDAGTPPAAWVIDALQDLVDRSLVVADRRGGATRFRLYVTIREFAAPKLAESGAKERAVRRHASHYLEASALRVGQLGGSGASDALAWLANEADNLTAIQARASSGESGLGADDGLRAATTLARLYAVRGPLVLALKVLDDASRVLRAPPPDALQADALHARALTLRLLGRLTEARDAALAARDAAERGGRAEQLGRVYEELGRAQVFLFQLTDASASYEKALAIYEALGDDLAKARVLTGIGGVLLQLDRLEPAKDCFTRALRIQQAAGNRMEEGRITMRLAIVESELGQTAAAEERFEVALRIHREVGDRVSEANALYGRGALEQEGGHLDEARRSYEKALELAVAMGHRLHEAFVRGQLGTCLQDLGDLDGAIASFEAALECMNAVDAPARAALWRSYLAAACATLGDAARAGALLDEADREVAGATDAVYFAPAVWVHRGHLDLARARAAAKSGDAAEASQHRRAARDRLERARALPRPQVEVRLAVRQLARALDDEPSALRSSQGGGAGALRVAANSAWVQLPGGTVVDFKRRGSLRQVLAELVRRRRVEPGQLVESSAVIAAVWPDEASDVDAMMKRLRVAVATLRKLGLEGVLVTRPGGYLLDPRVPLVVARPTEPPALR